MSANPNPPSDRELAQQRERAMAHDELMALHKANSHLADGEPDFEERARLLESVTETELETGDESLENLVAKDFPLSFYTEAESGDVTEYRWMIEIIQMFTNARYPHPKSGLQGLARAWAAGDPADRLEAKELHEIARDEGYLMGSYSRATRGDDGSQQEVAAKQVTESHAVTDRKHSPDYGGLLGRFRR